MVHAVIIAGGKGSRFWPKSRVRLPKQFLKLGSDRTMLQQTVDRIRRYVDTSNIYIVTNHDYAGEIKKLLPEISPANILVEPDNKETATCIGLAAIHLIKKNPDGIMVVLPSDHYITEEEKFIRVIRTAVKLAQETEGLITMGIKPTRPETGYGYIECSETIGIIGGKRFCRVTKFTEKPDLQKAKEYLGQGNYLWNSGMFVWKASVFLKAMKKFLPDIYAPLWMIKGAIGTIGEEEIVKDAYQMIRGISVDYGIMEKTSSDGEIPVYVIPSEFGWDDIGSLRALERIYGRDDVGNVARGKHFGIDTKNCIVDAQDKMIVTLGVEDLIIVDTDDVLLICDKNRDQEIKSVLTSLEKANFSQYL